MKKIIATKVKRYTAGSLAFVTAMIFSLPGNMQAQQSQAITAPSIDDVTYGVAPFSVAATSSSGLTVSYGIAGPATVDNATGVLTVLGKGSVTVFFFQDGDADYFPAAPKVESFTVNGASATVTLADASVTYDGSGQSLTPVQADSAGATLNEAITVTYADAAGTAVASPTNVGVYTATATISSDSNYSGSATGTLTITSAAATVTISGTSHSHDGSQKEVTVETVPAGLTVTTTYSGGSFVAKDAVDATYEDDGTTIKTPAEPAVTSPSDAGDYTVSVSVVDDNYSGSASATLTIGSVTIDSAAVTYTGVAQAPAVTVVPADLTHTVAYTDSAGADVASPTNAGTYTVVVTVTDARYPGDTSASYTINPAALTATLGSLSTSYGLGAPSSAEWAATLSYSGFVGTDAAAAVDASGLAVSYDKAVSDGGAYVATPADLSSGNYAISYVAGSLTVTKLSASVALSNTTQGYTGSVLGVSATPSVEGLAVTVVYRDANGALVASPTAKGTYYVTATIADANYEGSKTGTLTITKATTTLELPDLADVVYSTDPITVDVTVTGDRPVIFFVTGAAKASGNVITLNAAGSVRVTAYVAGTDDYESAYVADTFTVTKAPTSVTIADADSVYTGLGQSLTPSVADASGNAITVDAIDVTYADASGNAVASPTDVGVYTATATVNDTRYGGSATGTLTVLKAPLTITADDQTKEYLEANPVLTLTYTGFQNGEDSSVLTTQATVGTAADESSSLGDYGIVVYGATAANYTITHVDGALTIEKNTVAITLTDTSQTYTGSALAVTATPAVADINLVVTYADAAGAAVASPTNAGTYTVTATVDSSLYRGTQAGTLTIGQATATVTLADLAATYDGLATAATATTDPAGLTVDIVYSQGDTVVASPTDSGTYSIVASVKEDNYKGFQTGDLVISKKALSATADALTKVYGSANPAATITYSGFENSEDATVLDTAPAATIGADATSGVGDYDITLSAGTDNNYEITTANGKLTVTKAVVAVTADNAAKIYGAAVAAIGFTSTGYVNGDDVDDIDTKPTVVTTATAASDVGTYATTASGGADNNYSFAYTDGVLSISKATATITLSDNTATYDGKAHGVTVTTDPAGLEGSVTVKYDGSTNEPVFVASYAVTASMDDKNYTAADVTDTLTISQGAETYITLAELPDVYYGDPPLDLGLRASTGNRVMVFVAGPAVVGNDESRLVTVNDVGTVDILLYALGAGIPADQRFQAASFEVKKRNLLITADDKSRVYGADNPALTYTIQGFAPGEDESVFSTAPALTTTAASTTGVGDVAITFSTEAVDGTGHYTISHQPGTLTVAKAPLTVTGVNQSRTYGDGNPDAPAAQGLRVREYRGIGGTQVGDLTGNAKYPDGYDFQDLAGYFEWPQSGDINTKPAGNVRDNYGVVMEGYLTPTETASYEFYLAADDHAELWLSTDSDPANLVKIANEPSWNGVRSFGGTDRRAKADVDTITLTAPSALDVATTAGAIADAINAGSSDTSAKVTATSSAGVVTITAAKANSAISIASEVTNGGADDTQSGVLATTTAAAAAVDAVAEVLYVEGDTLPEGKAVGDVKTAAVAAVAAKAQVVTYTVSGVIEAGDSVKLTITGPRLETTSSPIVLAAGTSYYVRALMKEGGGGDNVAVAWAKSGDAAPGNDALPIPGSVLTPASTITYAYSGFVNGEDSSVLTSQPSGSIDASATTPVGDVDIVITGADAANYAVTHANGKLAVGPATLTVRADDKNEFETVALPDLTYSVSGFVNGEDASVVTTAPSLRVSDSGSIEVDLSNPGDSVTPTSDNHPGGEAAPNAIDNNTATKYLNFDKANTGLTITTGGGVVTGLKLTSANDAPERDPANFVLSGSNDGGATFVEIAAGDVPSFGARFETQSVSFANDVAYTIYKLIFPEVVNPGGANSMQIAEIELLSKTVPVPSGSADLSPGAYAIIPSGTVAANYAINHVDGVMTVKTVAKPKVTSVTVSNSKPLVGDKVTLTAVATGDILTFDWYLGSKLIEGETSNTLVLDNIGMDQSGRYTVFANNFKGKSRKLAKVTVSERANNVFLVVGANSSDDSWDYDTAPAAANGSIRIREYHGIGTTDISSMTGHANYPNSPDVDTLAPYFEWPQSGDINANPAGDVRNDYGWIADGYVYPPETANYKFYIATDDNSEVWLSTDDDPANAVKVAGESGWRGIRDYDQDGTAEDGESVSDPIALEAGKPYYIKVLTKEGGGGDNMALAWSIGDAAAPADGSAPIEGKYLAPGSVHPDYTADLALKQLLESQGFSVILQGPAHAVSDVDPSHMSFVVISSTLKDDSWAAKYAGTTAPVINLDGSAQDALGFIGGRDELTGSVSSATQVKIVDAGHPLAGGLSAGAQTVLSAAGTLNWGTPNAGAALVATAGSASHQGALYGYEAGSSMAGGSDAGGRRVNLPFQTADLGSLTSEGGALLVAAVDWVSGFSFLDAGGDLSASVGDSLVLNGRTIGDNITYQWYKNGAAIAGATSSSLDLGAVQAGNSGTYKVVATDPAAAWKYRFKEISYEVSVTARGDQVVLVTGSDALSASDTAVKGILTSKGFGVATATAADASSADLDGRLMAVVSPSVATSGGIVYENASNQGAYFASVKEFGDEVNLGLHNRLLDSLTFEYYGDFTADGDEKAVVRVYANDGAGADGVAQQPGTMLYESDPIAVAAGYNSVAVSGLLIEVPDTITWTVQFFGVGGSEGDRAGLVLHDPPSVGSSFDDFWINTGDVIYNSANDTVEAYYNTGTEFGDEIDLAGSSRLLNSIDFEAYAEISSAPSAATATLRIYANDGDVYGGAPSAKTPGTLLFTSNPITLSEGYKTYRVSGIGVELPDTVTWTVEFSGVTGNELNVGNRAALVLGGTDVVGSSLDDFWQKDESGWRTYQTSSAAQADDFTARLVAQSWRSYRDTDSVVLDNFGARVTAGVNVDFLEAANVPLVVVNPGLQADWGVADNATYAEGAALPSGAAAPERRAFVSSTDDSAAIGQAIDWVLETGLTTPPSGAELIVGESVTLSAAGYGPGDVTYQWKKDGANIDGQTGTDLALSDVATGAAGTYSVVVTGSNGGQAEASAEVKVFSLPAISLNRPVEGSTTDAITHQVKIWAVGGVDKIDLATASILINGVNVTANAKVTDGRRGLQATVDLVENADTDTISGTFLGYETLAPGTDNAMTVSLAFEPVGGDRVFTYAWSYTLYDASASGGSGIAKMAVNQIFQRGEDLYVIWPGSPGLVLERNSDCKGGIWEAIPSTVGKGIHVEKNCGTKAFFRLVRVRE